MQAEILLQFTSDFDAPLYSERTLREWHAVWKVVCDMAYVPSSQSYSLIHTLSHYSNEIEDCQIYAINKKRVKNHKLLCFEHVWKEYKNKKALANTTLLELYVPRLLIESEQAQEFIRSTFPNCTLIFWGE
jgi:hypothetical protein